jgi:hypothetical protein
MSRSFSPHSSNIMFLRWGRKWREKGSLVLAPNVLPDCQSHPKVTAFINISQLGSFFLHGFVTKNVKLS